VRRRFTRLVAALVRRRVGAGDGALALTSTDAGRIPLPGSRDAIDVTGLFLCDRSACDGEDLIGD